MRHKFVQARICSGNNVEFLSEISCYQLLLNDISIGHYKFIEFEISRIDLYGVYRNDVIRIRCTSPDRREQDR